MTLAVNDDDLTINVVAWDSDDDAEIIKAHPTYTIRAPWFPQEVMEGSGRVFSSKLENVQTQYTTDDGTFVSIITPTSICYLSPVVEQPSDTDAGDDQGTNNAEGE